MKSVIKQIAVLLLIAHVAVGLNVTQKPAPAVAPAPAPAPARWLGLIGEYGPDTETLYVLEKDGKLCASFKRAEPAPLREISKNVFALTVFSQMSGERLVFTRDRAGRSTQVKVLNVALKRRQIEPAK